MFSQKYVMINILKNSSRMKRSSQKVHKNSSQNVFLTKDHHEIFTEKKIGLILAIQFFFPFLCSKSLISRKENPS